VSPHLGFEMWGPFLPTIGNFGDQVFAGSLSFRLRATGQFKAVEPVSGHLGHLTEGSIKSILIRRLV